MHTTCEQVYAALLADLAAAESDRQIYQCKSRYLGKNGSITGMVRRLAEMSPEQRAAAGREINRLKRDAESAIEEALDRVAAIKKQQELERFEGDVTLPGRVPLLGTLHPITQITRRIVSIFSSMGFRVVEGPEVELDFFNFEALNIPKNHPARDMHDTFYLDDEVLLRTHTSPVQIRTMQKVRPPLRILCPGKVYRCDSDISHTPMFHQVEGLLVDREVSLSDLKGVLIEFVHCMFGGETKVRLRPSFFPFTEPSAEVDIGCVMCRGAGCRVCSGTGWLEILGCGMVHPAVFRNVGYDPEELCGFAFGLGVERIAMLKFGINDIRLFFENDIRFLAQFT